MRLPVPLSCALNERREKINEDQLTVTVAVKRACFQSLNDEKHHFVVGCFCIRELLELNFLKFVLILQMHQSLLLNQ